MNGPYRHEYKYAITFADYLELRPRLRTVLQPDPHVNADGTYQIQSIYFDNYQDHALREKIIGVPIREKWRIRWYNDDTSRFSLEKKVKVHALCQKNSIVISREECLQLLQGETVPLDGRPLLQEFFCRRKERLLKPRVVVSYRREPYLYKPGNVRITLDSDIRTSLYEHDFFRKNRVDIKTADDAGRIILEVKYDAYLPGVVADLIQLGHARQSAFSKYGAARKFG